MKRAAAAALCLLCLGAWGQPKPAGTASLGSVTVAASMPVEKSYRKMVEGMDLFDRMRAAHARGGMRAVLERLVAEAAQAA